MTHKIIAELSLNKKFENISGENLFFSFFKIERESNGTSLYSIIKTTAAAAAKSFQSCPTLCDPIGSMLLLFNYSQGNFCKIWLVEAQEKIRTYSASALFLKE